MEINAVTKEGLIYLCADGLISAYGRRCLFSDGVIQLQAKPALVSVRSTHKGRGSACMKLGFTGSNRGIVKKVNRGKGKGPLRLYIKMRGKGCVKSVVSSKTGKAAAEVVYKPAVGKILKPIYSTLNLSILLSHWGAFIPEISQPVMSSCTIGNINEQKDIEIEVLKEYLGSDEFRGDRRNWLVARVKYKKVPVMYLLNGGWPGVYNPIRFVLNLHVYQHMINYLFKMVNPDRGGESTYRGSIDGTVLDRVRRLQPEPKLDPNRIPPAIKELIDMYGDYDPCIRERVYGVHQ
jgi:hypothetical protein